MNLLKWLLGVKPPKKTTAQQPSPQSPKGLAKRSTITTPTGTPAGAKQSPSHSTSAQQQQTLAVLEQLLQNNRQDPLLAFIRRIVADDPEKAAVLLQQWIEKDR